MSKNLENLITTKEAKVAILGLGYVGLPLAVVFAEAGYNVIGIDCILLTACSGYKTHGLNIVPSSQHLLPGHN